MIREVKKRIKKALSFIFGFAILFGSIFMWEGLHSWKIGANLGEWFPMALIGFILAISGIIYHRDAWIFQPPMKSQDMKMYVEGKEYGRNGKDAA